MGTGTPGHGQSKEEWGHMGTRTPGHGLSKEDGVGVGQRDAELWQLMETFSFVKTLSSAKAVLSNARAL